MSTRATYKFITNEYTPNVTFYIHHDGYKMGASHYLYKMIHEMHVNTYSEEDAHGLYGYTYRTKSGGMAAAFIRANGGAEFTRDHDAHGDTEFQYTVNEKDMTITVREMVWMDDVEKWYINTFDLVEFINSNNGEGWNTTKALYSKESGWWGCKKGVLHTCDTLKMVSEYKLRSTANYSDDNINKKDAIDFAEKVKVWIEEANNGQPIETPEPVEEIQTIQPVEPVIEEKEKETPVLVIKEYSERAGVVFGDTKAIKNQLKSLKCRFNSRLTIDGEKVAGWVFSLKRMDEIKTALQLA